MPVIEIGIFLILKDRFPNLRRHFPSLVNHFSRLKNGCPSFAAAGQPWERPVKADPPILKFEPHVPDIGNTATRYWESICQVSN
jgi:hypothetical protein